MGRVIRSWAVVLLPQSREKPPIVFCEYFVGGNVDLATMGNVAPNRINARPRLCRGCAAFGELSCWSNEEASAIPKSGQARPSLGKCSTIQTNVRLHPIEINCHFAYVWDR